MANPADFNPKAANFEEWLYGGRRETYKFSPHFSYEEQVGPNPTWFSTTRLGQFLRRSPGSHIRMAAAAAAPMAGYGLRDASGTSFFQGAYHRLRSFNYPHDTWGLRYHKLRAGGHTDASARSYMRSKWPRPTDWADMRRAAPEVAKPGLRFGYLAGGLALASNLHFSVQNPFGPFYGFGAITASYGIGAAGLRLGWGLGAAAGRASQPMWGAAVRGATSIGAGLSRAGGAVASGGARGAGWGASLAVGRFSGWQTTGRVIGATSGGVGFAGRTLGRIGAGLSRMAGTTAGAGQIGQAATFLLTGGATIGGAVIGAGIGLAAPFAFEYAMETLPKIGLRLSRRGFGNLYGPYHDNRAVMTMRQQAVAAISQSHMNARNALGGEAALLHLA